MGGAVSSSFRFLSPECVPHQGQLLKFSLLKGEILPDNATLEATGEKKMNSIALTRAESREVDRIALAHFGFSGLVLMENAGRGVADVLERLGIDRPVVIACGKGNNAGDGLVIARHLDLRGHAVRVLLWADPAELRGDAGANYQILHKTSVPIEVVGPTDPAAQWTRHLGGAGWIVDALLGTGAVGTPRPPLADAIDAISAAGRPVLAVDIPSGLDCDTGEPSPHTIRATHTCTFFANKIGLTQPAALPYTGQVEVLDIGAPRCILETILRQRSQSPNLPEIGGASPRGEAAP